ncbi:uncharacterized protein ATNIH1004_010756 [Aspergillus tanneri]|uniref:Uncharacterized protein n=1 Tax=Aspergillus tanneri TaxID=1220188 RepID=A0A5M9MFS7_9EURO|nr:uncharacterized protein ATNIH1004_010756 [Aspergillus tanneri]KAA8641817.1 hypothetical protein ATNIH1004_010756 [Aspergillus tanneri]
MNIYLNNTSYVSCLFSIICDSLLFVTRFISTLRHHGKDFFGSKYNQTEHVVSHLDFFGLEHIYFAHTSAETERAEPDSRIQLCLHLVNEKTPCKQIDADEADGFPDTELQRRNLIIPPTRITTKDHPHGHHPTITGILLPPPRKTSTQKPTTSASSSSSTSTLDATLSTISSTTVSAETSTTPSSHPEPDPSGISGAKAGIGIGVFAILLIICFILRPFILRYKHRHKRDVENTQEPLQLKPTASGPLVMKKYGNEINELDGRVATSPPGPLQEEIFELSGEFAVPLFKEMDPSVKLGTGNTG